MCVEEKEPSINFKLTILVEIWLNINTNNNNNELATMHLLKHPTTNNDNNDNNIYHLL